MTRFHPGFWSPGGLRTSALASGEGKEQWVCAESHGLLCAGIFCLLGALNSSARLSLKRFQSHRSGRLFEASAPPQRPSVPSLPSPGSCCVWIPPRGPEPPSSRACLGRDSPLPTQSQQDSHREPAQSFCRNPRERSTGACGTHALSCPEVWWKVPA